MKRLPVLVLSVLVFRAAAAEDMDLHNRADQLMNRALVASRLTIPLNIRTEVNFTVTGDDGATQDGSYIRIRSADGALREDVTLGGYNMSRIQEQDKVSTHGRWVDIPYAVRKVFEFVPYLPIRFDSTDVITEINNTKASGEAALCIQFVTVRGEDRNPGEICLSKADGTVIEWHDRDHSFEALQYRTVKGASLPSHFVYREGTKLTLDASVQWTLLDSRPDDAFVPPADWHHAFYCKTYVMPVPVSAPQPSALGRVDAPVLTVAVRVHVRPDGTVGSVDVLKPVREDLDSEAVRLVKTWTYQPGACEGTRQEIAIDAEVHFQGR
jgi:TonB family protein